MARVGSFLARRWALGSYLMPALIPLLVAPLLAQSVGAQVPLEQEGAAPPTERPVQADASVQTAPTTEAESTLQAERPAQGEPTARTGAPANSAESSGLDEVDALRAEMKELRAAIKDLRGELATQSPEPGASSADSAKKSPYVLAKNRFYLGGTAGIDYRNRDNVTTLLGSTENGHRLRLNFEGVFGRMLRDELGVGLVVQYRRTSREGELSEDPSLPRVSDAVDYSLRAGPTLRQFFALDPNRIFFIYYQASLVMGYTEKVERTFESNSSSVATANGYSLGVGVQPGLMIAASDRFSVEVGINVLGLEYSHYKTRTDYTDVGKEDEVDFSFDVNLLSLQFAFVGYF